MALSKYRDRYYAIILVAASIASGSAATAAPDPATAAIHKCDQHLAEIGRAIKKFQRDVGDLPPALSALYPTYLKDKGLLHCPADPGAGSADVPGATGLPVDPNMPDSYSYEMSPDALGSNMSFALVLTGPGPAPTTWREWKLRERARFGDWVPMVRCWHHWKQDHPTVLNLTLEGKVYESPGGWELYPPVISTVAEHLSADLRGSRTEFLKKWVPEQVNEYFGAVPVNTIKLPSALRMRLMALGRQIRAAAPKVGNPDASLMAGVVFTAAGDKTDANALLGPIAATSGDDSADAAADLGYLALAQGDRPVAIKYFQRLANRYRARLDYLQALLSAYGHDYPGIIKYAETRLKDASDPDSRKMFQSILIQAYTLDGQKQKAEDLRKSAGISQP